MTRLHRTDRIVPFTDAVVAIAITLLILPLVEIGQQAQQQVQFGGFDRLGVVLLDGLAPLIGFTISFFVIARLWWAHHTIFEDVRGWTVGMVVANTGWLFTIVLLPWVTTLSTAFLDNWAVALLYVGTMTASSAFQTLLARLVLRAAPQGDTEAEQHYYGNLTTTIAFAVALVICVAVPASFYSPLILLAFTGLVDRRVKRRLERRRGAAVPSR